MFHLILRSSSFLMWPMRGKRLQNANVNMASLSVWKKCMCNLKTGGAGGVAVKASALVLLDDTAIHQLTHCTDWFLWTWHCGCETSFEFALFCIVCECCCGNTELTVHRGVVVAGLTVQLWIKVNVLLRTATEGNNVMYHVWLQRDRASWRGDWESVEL